MEPAHSNLLISTLLFCIFGIIRSLVQDTDKESCVFLFDDPCLIETFNRLIFYRITKYNKTRCGKSY